MFKILAVTLVLFLAKQCHAGDEFYDNRCICICPSFTVIGEKDTGRKVYIDIKEKEECTCENVLSEWKKNQTEMLKSFCPRCNCRFEVRNTTTMKIVVIIIICVLTLLFIYMGFLLCLDPLMNTRRAQTSYQPQLNEDINMDTSNDEPQSSYVSPSYKGGNVINRVTQEQSKWKRQVQEQRRTVYDKHVILN